MTSSTVTCLTCGWVSLAVSRAEAEAAVAEFNAHLDTLPEADRQRYRGDRRTSLADYQCHCGAPAGYRLALPGDCPTGCTIGPVIWEDPTCVAPRA